MTMYELRPPPQSPGSDFRADAEFTFFGVLRGKPARSSFFQTLPGVLRA